MSLDIYLIKRGVHGEARYGVIFVRENGSNVELSREEWDKRYPGREPVTVDLPCDDERVSSHNITHNLGKMAGEAGIYQALWRPEEIGCKKAADIVPLLTEGLAKLKADPEHYKQFDSPNGWGLYIHFVPFVERVLDDCRTYPDAELEVSR